MTKKYQNIHEKEYQQYRIEQLIQLFVPRIVETVASHRPMLILHVHFSGFVHNHRLIG